MTTCDISSGCRVVEINTTRRGGSFISCFIEKNKRNGNRGLTAKGRKMDREIIDYLLL